LIGIAVEWVQTSESKPLDFFEAEAHCNKFNAHLASFHNVDEMEFLEALTPSNYVWLGLFHAGECLHSLPNYKLYFTDGSKYAEETFSSTATKHFEWWANPKGGASTGVPAWNNDPEHLLGTGASSSLPHPAPATLPLSLFRTRKRL